MFRHPINKAIIIAVIIISGIFFVKYGAKSYIFYGDGLGYYMYLPATFIFHNVDNMAELPKDKGIDEWAMIFTSNSLHDQGKNALGALLYDRIPR